MICPSSASTIWGCQGDASPLTIVAQPLEQLGIYAARRILSRLEDPDEVPISITLSASLKIGTSVGVPRHVEDE